MMLGWAKLLEEKDGEVRIAYSMEENETCDGELRYDKSGGCYIVKLAKDSTHKQTMSFSCPLRYALEHHGLKLGEVTPIQC